jgi:biopolymer transport protein ExbD
MISLVFVRSEFFTSHSEGLMVRTLPTFSRVMRSPGDEPIIVTIDEGKHYFVNSKGVAPIALQSALADALSVHFTKVVFVQADREVDFGTVVLAVDAIKGAGAQAVLVSEPPKETK